MYKRARQHHWTVETEPLSVFIIVRFEGAARTNQPTSHGLGVMCCAVLCCAVATNLAIFALLGRKAGPAAQQKSGIDSNQNLAARSIDRDRIHRQTNES